MAEKIREIALDTETTGFSSSDGADRIVELGCVELINHTPTGKTFHAYINPEREVPESAIRVHGLTTEFLSVKPKFADVAQDFLEFIGDAVLVIHNAPFDIPFLNMELARANRAELSWERVIDTLELSRRKNPQLGQHNLDALCRRYGIDNSERKDAHGALLDARLLASVYIELIGGKEVDFFKVQAEPETMAAGAKPKIERVFHPARSFPVIEEELAAHEAFVASLGGKTVWGGSC
jgi:DNA polymerase-3 subunit epsilon